MTEPLGMTYEEKQVNIMRASELLHVAKQLGDLPAIQDDLDSTITDYRNGLVEMALYELMFVIEVADAEDQQTWSRDPRNPSADLRKRLGFTHEKANQ